MNGSRFSPADGMNDKREKQDDRAKKPNCEVTADAPYATHERNRDVQHERTTKEGRRGTLVGIIGGPGYLLKRIRSELCVKILRKRRKHIIGLETKPNQGKCSPRAKSLVRKAYWYALLVIKDDNAIKKVLQSSSSVKKIKIAIYKNTEDG